MELIQKYNEKLAIIIPACDKYLDIFSEYMRYFRINWIDCPFEIILVTEVKYYNDPRVTSLITSTTTNWTGRVLEGIKHTKCKYILTTIEDGFISKKVNTEDVFDILNFMEHNNIVYYRNPKTGHIKTKGNSFKDFEYACKIEKDGIYSRTLGIDIWNRDALIDLFGDGTKTAWDVENYFLEYAANSLPGYFDDWVSDSRNFLNVIETVSKGKWIPSAIIEFKKLKIPINIGNRGILPYSDTIRRNIHKIMNYIVPKKYRKSTKSILSRFGFKFASKN